MAIAHPCQAVQVSDFASPPPTPITRAPARDLATSAAPVKEPTRYAPPVHVTPPASYTARVTQAAYNSESVNGRRNMTRLVTYSEQAAVTKLSDETLSADAETAQPSEARPQRDLPTRNISRHAASGRFNGLHGYRPVPTRAVEPLQHGKIRRPGLQDHIADAFDRMSASRSAANGTPENAEPTEAVIDDGQQFAAEKIQVEEPDSPVATVGYYQTNRGGVAKASNAFKRRQLAAKRARANARPEEIVQRHRSDEVDAGEKLFVRHDDAVQDRPLPSKPNGLRKTIVEWVNNESDLEDDSLEPVEFATDYQRPMTVAEDKWEADRVDEEVMPTARVAAIQQRAPVRPPQLAKARSYSRPLRSSQSSSQSSTQRSSQRSRSTRGKQVSVLTRSRQGSDTREGSSTRLDDDFPEAPNRLRDNQRIEKIDDFDPLNDSSDSSDALDDFEDDDVDDLDRDIDEELKQLRDRSEEDDLDDDEDEEDDSEPRVEEKECATFRNELLNSSIRDIPLDISPPASSLPGSTYPIARSWTDQSGNVVATGAMQDLRRGYVILDSGQKLPYATLSEADLAAVSEFWRLPKVCSVGNRGSAERSWTPQTFTWTASNVCHKTLFFENVQLERYGHSHGPFTQPVQSVAHFFVSLATLSYQAAIHPANECNYALGYYRPGNCAPWLKDPIPISLDGAKRQILTTTGLAFIP